MLGKKKYYYNIKTGQVEEGRQSAWTQLMGPYPTREAAEHALQIARERTQAWDAAEQSGAGRGEPEERDVEHDDASSPDWGSPSGD